MATTSQRQASSIDRRQFCKSTWPVLTTALASICPGHEAILTGVPPACRPHPEPLPDPPPAPVQGNGVVLMLATERNHRGDEPLRSVEEEVRGAQNMAV